MQQLYQRYYDKLFYYAKTFLQNDDDAFDEVSNVFQHFYEIQGYSMEHPSSFLYTSVRNRCLDRLRHQKAQERYARLQQGSHAFANDEEVAEFEQRILRVSQAINALPEPGRSVLHCTYFEKLTYRQTAIKLNMSENMVHKYMLKMFRLLREILN